VQSGEQYARPNVVLTPPTQVISQCHSIGVEVVKSIDDLQEYEQFLLRTKQRFAGQLQAIEDQKAAKLLRQT
jgi:hypothetical protein